MSGPADAPLTPAERAHLAALRVPKRRAEWLVGRTTAKAVVADAMRDARPGAWPLDAIEIANEPCGRPYARVAPAARPLGGFAAGERLPVSVSISHAEGLALCAAALCGPERGRPRRTVGIDLGALEARSPAFAATFFTEDEQRFVRDAPWWERDLRANLVWGAKEAVLKALGLGLTVDTVGLCCLPAFRARDGAGWSISPSGGEWRPFHATCGPAVLPHGGTVHGVWRAFPGLVGAVAWHAAA